MIVVIIVVVPLTTEFQAYQEHGYQQLKAIEEARSQRLQQQLDDYRSTAHKVCCDLCGLWTEWYTTPGKAKMGLSGHQRWCRKRHR